MTLLEITVATALLSLVALGSWAGLESLQAQSRLEAARMHLVLVLSEARRDAYASGNTVIAEALPGSPAILLRFSDGRERRFALRDGVAVVDAPSRGGVRFLDSGWAENATFTLGWPDGQRAGRASVIVNQRGRIR